MHLRFLAKKWTRPWGGAGWLLLLLAGCAVGPNYKQPTTNAPQHFRSDLTEVTNSLADLPWWEMYSDPTLTNLIHTALTNNYDVRIAVTRLEQAQAILVQTRSQMFPAVGYNLEATRGKNAVLGAANPQGNGATGNDFYAALNATWEIDLWGRLRRMTEAARAQYLASEEARRGVVLSLIANVAQTYFQLLYLDRQIEIAREATNSYGGSLKIFTERQVGGVASKLETSLAEGALTANAATVPDLERQIALQENQLSVYLGVNPGPIARPTKLLQQSVPPEIPAGLPSDLLRRRPDVLQAEEMVRAANAQIGALIGDFFPKIGLTALFGGITTDLAKISGPNSLVWSVGADVTGPLFQGGRLFGAYRQTKAAWEEAKLEYQQTALNAFQDVANALIAHQKLEEVRLQQVRSVTAYHEALEVATKRYQAGQSSYYEVLTTQQDLFPEENALAQTQYNQLLNIVQLYQALGGGWTNAPTQATQTH